ncbi:hypothetical protein L3476_25510 [Paenibacillus thiaminolyticus]|nr:hypothetical protein [Paenibacillus thiaminolyticus]WCR26542.1 hypothetical protein L3476_25510 [Paenibacillus thiaminolyticus]
MKTVTETDMILTQLTLEEKSVAMRGIEHVDDQKRRSAEYSFDRHV